MKLHQIINAQEANENAFRNCVISRAVFEAKRDELAKAYTVAIIAAQRALIASGV
jgi:hypothetical protein